MDIAHFESIMCIRVSQVLSFLNKEPILPTLNTNSHLFRMLVYRIERKCCDESRNNNQDNYKHWVYSIFSLFFLSLDYFALLFRSTSSIFHQCLFYFISFFTILRKHGALVIGCTPHQHMCRRLGNKILYQKLPRPQNSNNPRVLRGVHTQQLIQCRLKYAADFDKIPRKRHWYW